MGRLELGLMTLGDLLPHPTTGRVVSEAERHRSLVDQAVLAERLGFTAVHLGEHHFSDYMLSAPPVVLAAIGERTTDLKLSTAVTLAGNLDPVRVAEDYATVDALSGGRVEIVTGRGNLFTHTYAGFGQPVEDARERYDESVTLLDLVLREEKVNWSGRYRPPLTGHTTRPRPTGAMPLWIGAGSMASADLAAELGAALMLPTVIGTPELFAPIVDHYRQRWSELGRDDGDAKVGACSHSHVTTGDVTDWAPYYNSYWDFVGTLLAADRWMPFDFDALMAGPAIAGSPGQVIDRIGHWQQTLTLDRHLFMFDLGGMETGQVLDVMELFGAEVMGSLP
jgi:alkanesulfonate monooxygenase SsuD/methylene tetrahydromethanopterin reductase-like flavin-dependent oxidoreductase (luciferase family)